MSKVNKKDWLIVIALAFMHLLCDFICGFRVVGIFGVKNIEYSLYIFILYNSLAFLCQPLIGLVIDKYFYGKQMLIISCFCLLFGVLIDNWIIGCIFLGIGNQVFHVIGGKICTNMESKKASHLGVFVSLGAIGIALGSTFYYQVFTIYFVFIVYMLLAILVCLYLPSFPKKEKMISKTKTNKVVLGISLMTVVVFIRSFLGKIVHFDFFLTTTLLIIIPTFGAFGKFIGGFLRDKFGSLQTVLISMILCMIILIFASDSVPLMCLGVLLINISMPISLYELNQLFQGHEAFNFGILAAVLFPGVALGLVTPYVELSYIIIVIISCTLTILSIYIVSRWSKKND